jgi:Protein of unknown function (DUF1653)
MPDIKMGIYRHYKGPLYQVLGLAHDANDENRICVVYIGLQLDEAHLGPRLAVRNLEKGPNSFISRLCISVPEGCSAEEHLEVDPKCYSCIEHVKNIEHFSRFTYLGPYLTSEMIV